MRTKNKNSSVFNYSTLRKFGLFSISIFLFIMLLTAFVVVPKFNELLESQHNQDMQIELALEAALFTRFINSQKTIIQDLAAYPSIISAVMLSDATDRGIYELLDNVVIGGEKSRLVLQDIAGNILVKTDNELRGNYNDSQLWLEQILNETIPYHFRLLGQDGLLFTFKISVPVLYNNYVEGVLSSEITTSLDDVFISNAFNKGIAFKLIQDSVIISTGTDHIITPHENTLLLKEPNLTFTFITDNASIESRKRSLQNTILFVLLFSFVLSFFLFAFIGYRSLLQKRGLQKKQVVFLRAYALPIVIGMIGVGASVAGFMISSNFKDSTNEKELVFASKQKVKTIQKNIDSNLQVLDSVRALYNASNDISRENFNTFVAPTLITHRNIHSIGWVSQVSHAQRAIYEQQLKAESLKRFSIVEKNENGELITANVRDSYFPVSYLEPIRGNEQIIGFDLASNAKRLAAIKNAQKHGDKVATAPIVLLLGKAKEQAGVLVFNPIYQQKTSTNGISLQRKLKGFALLVLKTDSLFMESMNEESGLLLYIEDVTESEKNEVIYGVQPVNSHFSHAEVITFAGRSWRITSYSNVIKKSLDLATWLVLISGLLISSMFTFGIAYLIHRREIVEKLVNSRTRALQESEEQYRAVVENAVDGLLTIDERGTIEKFNQAAQRIFGYTAEEVIGVNIKILMPEPYHGEHDGYLKNYRDTGVKKIIGIGRYVQGKRKNGSIFPIDLAVSEIKFGETRKFSGMVRDVSERVALEEEREKFIEKLTDSNEELERFAFVCSHDLQEPLRMVRSFSEKLREHIADYLVNDEKGTKYFHFIIDGAERSQALISDILTYSSISSDTQILEPVNVGEIIRAIKNNIINSNENTTVNITSEPMPILQGNKTQLLQLFQNLINNGLKYQTAGNIPRVHIGVEDTEKHWTFSIKDNGIGMEERHLKKIFDVFQRLHRRSKYAGTGIGLSICKKVVERHEGIIWVESEKDAGSTFYVKLLKPIMTEDI